MTERKPSGQPEIMQYVTPLDEFSTYISENLPRWITEARQEPVITRKSESQDEAICGSQRVFPPLMTEAALNDFISEAMPRWIREINESRRAE